MIQKNSENDKSESYTRVFNIKDNKELILRIPEESDAQGLIDYLKKVDEETRFLAREPDEFNFTLEQEKAFIKSLADDRFNFMILGEVDRKIVANCSVGIVMNKLRYLHRATLGLAVRQDFWRMGIGTLMMQECIAWCKDKKVEQLELEVVTENTRAVRMYENLGFQVYGTRKHAMKYSDGTYADEHLMILDIE